MTFDRASGLGRMSTAVLPALLTLSLLTVSPPASVRADEVQMHPALAPLLPFCGKTWRGEFAGSTPERPMFDVSRWELALNGQAVRILHSINDGEYGGETIIMFDPSREALAFWYFTTAGFHTTGTLEVTENGFRAVEEVVGNQEGITKVTSTSEILADGRLRGSSRYLKHGEWVDGHSVVYEQAPDATVVFRD